MIVLKKRSDFINAQNKGNKIVTRTIVVQAVSNNLSEVRVGYTVSKKVSKLAVTRNKIKRRLRAAVREAMVNAKPGTDYVLIGRLEAFKADYTIILEDLKYAVRKLDKR